MLAPSAFGHNVTHFRSHQGELWPGASNAAAERRTERDLCGHWRGKCTEWTVEQASRQVLLWFDSLWSVRLSQMSSVITADLHRTRCTDEIRGLQKSPSSKPDIEWLTFSSKAWQKYERPTLAGGTFLYPSDLSNTSRKDLPAFVKGKKNSGGDWVNPLHVDKTDWLWQDKTVPWLRCYSSKYFFFLLHL